MSPPESVPQKRPYQKPQLLVYGDLTEMTKTTGPMGMMDGGPVKGHMMTA